MSKAAGFNLKKVMEEVEDCDSKSFYEDGRKEIYLERGDLHVSIAEAEGALLNANAVLFQRGGVLVRPIQSETSNDGGVRRNDGSVMLSPIDEHWLSVELSTAAVFLVFNNKAKKYIKVDPPKNVSRSYLSLNGNWKFPHLRGIAQSPLIRLDGTVLDRPGFDAQTGIYADFNLRKFDLSKSLTRDDAKLAMEVLQNIFKPFSFVADEDLSVALSGVLSAIQAPLVSAPLHAFTAPVPASGKSKICDVISIIATGRPSPALSWGSSDEESEKRFHSMLRAADQVVLIDNIERPFGGESLCSFLTQSEIAIRPLGKSHIERIPRSTFVVITGNNLCLKGDINRRTVMAMIDPKVERPELRKFDVDPTLYVLRHRVDFLECSLGIMKAYHDNACPPVDMLPLGSFEAWSKAVRAPLIWAGCADPCKVMERSRRNDPQLEALSALLENWYLQFGSVPTPISDVIRNAKTIDFNNAIQAIVHNDPPAFTLGSYLSRWQERIVDGKKFVKSGKRNGSILWAVVNEEKR